MNLKRFFLFFFVGIICSVSVVSATDINDTVVEMEYNSNTSDFEVVSTYDELDSCESGSATDCIKLNGLLKLLIDGNEYNVVSTYDELVSACGPGGVRNIKLGENIKLLDNIPVTHNVKILGDKNIFYLNNYNFILSKDVIFEGKNIAFNNGDYTTRVVNYFDMAERDNTQLFNNC